MTDTNSDQYRPLSDWQRLEERVRVAEAELHEIREWLDHNTTFYDVDADYDVEGHNVPVLAQVSNRIWYHATDDVGNFPFSAVIDSAIAAAPSTEKAKP